MEIKKKFNSAFWLLVVILAIGTAGVIYTFVIIGFGAFSKPDLWFGYTVSDLEKNYDKIKIAIDNFKNEGYTVAANLHDHPVTTDMAEMADMVEMSNDASSNNEQVKANLTDAYDNENQNQIKNSKYKNWEKIANSNGAIHFYAVILDKDEKTVADGEVELFIKRPSGDEFYQIPITRLANGEIQSPSFELSRTGTYLVQLKIIWQDKQYLHEYAYTLNEVDQVFIENPDYPKKSNLKFPDLLIN